VKKNTVFNKNFVLLLIGQNISKLGNEIHYLTLVFWLQYTLDSTFLLGLTLSIGTFTLMISSFFTGVIADRHSRKALILISDFGSSIFVFYLAILFFTGKLDKWNLIIITIVLSFFSALLRPAYDSLLPDLVDSKVLMRANSINGITERVSGIVGPSLAGLIYQLSSIGILFIANGVSFLISGIMDIFIEIPKFKNTNKRKKSFFNEMKSGLELVYKDKVLKYIIIYTALLNVFGAPMIILLPKYLQQNLDANNFLISIVLSAKSIGAFIALTITAIISKQKKWLWKIFMITAIGSWILTGLCGILINKYFVVLAYILIGACNVISITILSTSIQLYIPSENRGKFFGLFGVLAIALNPLSMFIMGLVGEYVYVPYFYIISSIINISIIIFICFIKKDFKKIFN